MVTTDHSKTNEQITSVTGTSISVVTEAHQMPDKVLRRLMEEVKNESVNPIFAYDRAHNRHNRGR